MSCSTPPPSSYCDPQASHVTAGIACIKLRSCKAFRTLWQVTLTLYEYRVYLYLPTCLVVVRDLAALNFLVKSWGRHNRPGAKCFLWKINACQRYSRVCLEQVIHLLKKVWILPRPKSPPTDWSKVTIQLTNYKPSIQLKQILRQDVMTIGGSMHYLKKWRIYAKRATLKQC